MLGRDLPTTGINLILIILGRHISEHSQHPHSSPNNSLLLNTGQHKTSVLLLSAIFHQKPPGIKGRVALHCLFTKKLWYALGNAGHVVPAVFVSLLYRVLRASFSLSNALHRCSLPLKKFIVPRMKRLYPGNFTVLYSVL